MSRLHNPESAIVRQILEWLRLKGIFAWRNTSHPVPGRKYSGLRGVADILGCLDDGRFLAIEVKTATGRVRPEQMRFLAAVTDRGGLAFVARSLDDVMDRLDKHGG